MILFCDTSALVKLYVVEEDSEITHRAAQKAEILAVSRIAWAEFHAALARRARMVPADESVLDEARDALVSQWADFLVLDVRARARRTLRFGASRRLSGKARGACYSRAYWSDEQRRRTG